MSAEHAGIWRSAARDAGAETAQPSPAPVAQAGGFPAPSGERGKGREGEACPDALGVLRPFNPVSWFHPKGIYRVLARLMPRLPNVAGCLFLTFTFNPALFADPAAAFEHGRDKLRRMFHRLRRGVVFNGIRYVVNEPYAVKVEFHQNGWAHFHVIFLTRRYIPAGLFGAIWGLGRTNLRRIANKDFHYLLKYVTKGGGLPDWVLNRSRLRVFQSSQGFLSGTAEPRKPSQTTGLKRRMCTLGERIRRWSKTAILQSGEQYRELILPRPFFELMSELVYPLALAGRYLGGGHFKINDVEDIQVWLET